MSDSHSFSTIDSIDCELSVVSDRSGEKVKTVARIKIRTYTAIMPPTMKAIAFQTLFARLFLIASCSLIRESCSGSLCQVEFIGISENMGVFFQCIHHKIAEAGISLSLIHI